MRSFVSSLVRLARWWMFTFPRTAKQAAPEALRSFGSAPKSTPSRQLSSSTGARWEDAQFAWTSRKIARARRASDAISAGHRLAEAATTSVVVEEAETPAGKAMGATTSRATARISTAAATTEAVARRSTSPSAPKAADAVCAARNAASSPRFAHARQINTRARYEPRPSARCVVPPRSANLELPVGGVLISRRQSYGKASETRLSTSILGHICLGFSLR